MPNSLNVATVFWFGQVSLIAAVVLCAVADWDAVQCWRCGSLALLTINMSCHCLVCFVSIAARVPNPVVFSMLRWCMSGRAAHPLRRSVS